MTKMEKNLYGFRLKGARPALFRHFINKDPIVKEIDLTAVKIACGERGVRVSTKDMLLPANTTGTNPRMIRDACDQVEEIIREWELLKKETFDLEKKEFFNFINF